LKYQALLAGDADVATAFTTDGAIATNHLRVLDDDKHLWPPYNIAPLVRSALNAADPRIATTLDRISPRITNAVAQSMNAAVEAGGKDPADVAAAFLKAQSR
jgi:osmoprotectant transport system substrate-binding protein